MHDPPAICPSNQDIRDAYLSPHLARRLVAEVHNVACPGDVTADVHQRRTDLQMQGTTGQHLRAVTRVKVVALCRPDDEVGREHVPDGRGVVEAVFDSAHVAVGERRIDGVDQPLDLLDRRAARLLAAVHDAVEPGLSTPRMAATTTSAQIT
jgi:hypothetical protein